ncbi:MAG: long-chain fatty acid--CoA ligase [Myxococcales bacterium]|nr:long-chain fatty acid--CoA ligase [Myxococcales bacterium]
MSPHTLVHQLLDWAARTPNAVALRHKQRGHWEQWTWAQYAEQAKKVAAGLVSLGHQPDECVAIVGDNRAEWVIIELGIMMARGIPAPIYTTNTAAQAAYIVQNSEAKLVVVDGAAQLAKLRAGVEEASLGVETFVSMDAVAGAPDGTVDFAGLVARATPALEAEVDARVTTLTGDNTALLIYTSGTTGVPKGVMLDHGGLLAMSSAVLAMLPMFDAQTPAEARAPYRTLSYLPLCHGAEQLITTMGHLRTGGTVSFCPDMKQLKDYLVEVRPTLFLGVPRIWEKFQAALTARLDSVTGAKGALARWARSTELAAAREEAASGRRVHTLRRALANRLVIRKLAEALGLDELRYAITGSAPISVATLEFFASLGIAIHEAYGMSETSGVCTITPPGAARFGRVGKAIDGVGIRIAEDGEVQLHGRIMTRGYFRMPDETRELYTDDGWLHTGDLGDLDADGYLAITGRKKELLITAGGKNVAPAELEAYLQEIPGVAQAVVVGDREPYLAALITIDVEQLPALATQLGVAPTLEAVASAPGLHALLDPGVETRCNARVARYQTIKRYRVLPVEFSVDGGELTPTMKLRRTEIAKKYADEIRALYA